MIKMLYLEKAVYAFWSVAFIGALSFQEQIFQDTALSHAFWPEKRFFITLHPLYFVIIAFIAFFYGTVLKIAPSPL